MKTALKKKQFHYYTDRIDTLYEAEIARCENEMKAAEAVEEAARLAEARNAQQGAHAIQQSNVFPGQVDQGTSSVPLIPPNDKIPNKPESIASATDSSSIETAIGDAYYSIKFTLLLISIQFYLTIQFSNVLL